MTSGGGDESTSSTRLAPPEIPFWLERVRRIVSAVHRRVHVARTLHAAPFPVIGVLIARPPWPTLGETVLILISVLFGRALAVSLLRYFGAPEDVINPRTRREQKKLDSTPRAIWLAFAIHAALVFVFVAWMQNELTGKLSIGVVGLLLLYATVRARTGVAHFLLGLGLGVSPIGAFLALRGTIDADVLAPTAIGIGTMLWAAGFDMLFSLQPRLRQLGDPGAFERPMAFAAPTVAAVSRVCHALAIAAFVAALPLGSLKPGFLIGPALATTCLVIAHLHTRTDDARGLAGDFYRWNLLVGPSLLVGAVLAR